MGANYDFVELNKIYLGDALEVMRSWPDAFVQMVVTSPPYWGLRDYKVNGQLGLEKTPEEYVAKMVEVFREVRRVLRGDGTLWLNMGDTFAGSGKGQGLDQCYAGPKQATNAGSVGIDPSPVPAGLKPKDLVGIPWRLAFAMQAAGWYLRSDIIWAKPNPMPESVTDRPTKAHEYLFLLSKSDRYYYDAEAIKEPASEVMSVPAGWNTGPGRHDTKDGRYELKDLPEGQVNIRKTLDKQRGHGRRHAGFNDRWDLIKHQGQCSSSRNKRDVWTVATSPFPEAHFATFPPDLIKPCILASTRPGDIVLDPFMGAGTTALVAAEYNRRWLGIEINSDYVKIAEARIANEVAQMKINLDN